MRLSLVLFQLAVLAGGCVLPASAQRNKQEKEEITQTLQVPRELPNAVAGETRKLTFHVSPLSAKGLLSQQIRDALRALDRSTGSSVILKLRAFVAGSGDVRRVRELVSEIFTDRRQPLPALSLIRAGALPLEGAQVVIEAVASGRREVNPGGLVFISPHVATSGNPLDAVAPLVVKSLEALRHAVKAAGSEPADVLRVTCFLSTLDDLASTRKRVQAEYPRAALNYVQPQRAPGVALAACEAVARARRGATAPLQLLNPDTGGAEKAEAQVAIVASPQLIFTGTQASFGYQEQDSRLAFERLGRALEQAGTTPANVAFARFYPLAAPIAAQIHKIRAGFFDGSRMPAGSLLLFEGLPAMDAGFAVDVIAVKQ